MPGGPEISKFEKRKKKAKAEKIRVFQDAANSCCIGGLFILNLYYYRHHVSVLCILFMLQNIMVMPVNLVFFS